MKHTQHGVSLIELLSVVSIVAILVAIGVPSFKSFITSNRTTGEVNALLSDMQFARSEAVKEGQPVTICPSSSAGQNQCDGNNSTSWQKGWIVFSDANASQLVANPPSTYILRRQPAFVSALDTFVADSGLTYVTFNREGFATNFPVTATGYATITLHSTPNTAQWTRCLQIFSTGMMGTERTTDPQGNCQ